MTDLGNSQIIVVGDIHGCSTALRTLLDLLQLTPDDTLITLGDHIDWGPDSRGVIDQLIELNRGCSLISLLGNHEEMMINALYGRLDLEAWNKLGGEATISSYAGHWQWDDLPPAHRDFFQSCRLFHETESAIFVHANYFPNRTMPQQSTNDLLWEPIDEQNTVPHYSGKTVFCGHTPQTSGRILDLGFLVCLDTDCSRGGWLTAVDVHSGQVWQTDQKGQTRTSFRQQTED